MRDQTISLVLLLYYNYNDKNTYCGVALPITKSGSLSESSISEDLLFNVWEDKSLVQPIFNLFPFICSVHF